MRVTLMTAAACALALAGCGTGGDDGGGAAAAEDREAAEVRLRQCLRENGLDIPDGGGRGVEIRIERGRHDKAQEAMRACRKEQAAAFPEPTPQERQEMEDRFQRFQACMRKQGVKVPPIVFRAGGPGEDEEPPPPPKDAPDPDDPDVRRAHEACQDELPMVREERRP